MTDHFQCSDTTSTLFSALFPLLTLGCKKELQVQLLSSLHQQFHGQSSWNLYTNRTQSQGCGCGVCPLPGSRDSPCGETAVRALRNWGKDFVPVKATQRATLKEIMRTKEHIWLVKSVHQEDHCVSSQRCSKMRILRVEPHSLIAPCWEHWGCQSWVWWLSLLPSPSHLVLSKCVHG